jgi:hypothetical protein
LLNWLTSRGYINVKINQIDSGNHLFC